MIDWSILVPMPRRASPLESQILQGTLDILVLPEHVVRAIGRILKPAAE
jgi:hypothetical protein